MYRSLKNMNAASGITQFYAQVARDIYMINSVFINGEKKLFCLYAIPLSEYV